MIVFERRKLKTKIRSPLKNFEVEEHEIEYRKDPLVERWCRININRLKRPKHELRDEAFLKKIIEASRKNCPFCEENIERATAKFFELEGRMKLGDCVIFPNLFPYGTNHAVVVLSTRKHYLSLNEMNQKILFNSIKNSLEFFKVAYKKTCFKYPSINFNLMPPSAASLIHPHLQVLLDERPTCFTNLLIEKSLAYYQKFKKNFWNELVKKEKEEGERFIGETGSFAWIADFCPIKNNQISGITNEKISSLTELEDENIKDLSLGLSKIFKKFYKNNINSLNMCIFSGPIGVDASEYFSVNLKIISRPNLAQAYTTDIGFMELIHQESVVETLPEEITKKFKL